MKINATEAALYGKLQGDSTLMALLASTHSVFAGAVPQDETLPCVVFQKQSGTSHWTFKLLVADELVYVVKGIAVGQSKKAANTIAERIDALLNDAQLTITGGALLYLRRAFDVDHVESVEGQRINHVGAGYRLLVT